MCPSAHKIQFPQETGCHGPVRGAEFGIRKQTVGSKSSTDVCWPRCLPEAMTFPVIAFTAGGEKPWEGEARSRRNVHLTFTPCCYPPQLRAEGELQSWLSSRDFPHLYAGPKQGRETAESGKASHSSQPGFNSNKVLESTEKIPKVFLGTVRNIYSQGTGCTAAQETLLQMIKSDRQNFLNHITGKNSRSPLVLYAAQMHCETIPSCIQPETIHRRGKREACFIFR